VLIINSNCNTKKIEVFDKSTSILYDFAIIEKNNKQIVLNNSTTNPLLFDFLNPTLNTKVEFDAIDSWFYINYFLFKSYNGCGATITDKNKINNSAIYNSFIGFDYILIDNVYYEIDKSKSSDNQLFLKKPLPSNTVTNCNFGKGNKESQIGYSICESNKKILKEVLDSKCTDCAKEYEKHYKELIQIQLLKSDCISDEDVKSIVKSITDKYAFINC
jgi:hypothetical protein